MGMLLTHFPRSVLRADGRYRTYKLRKCTVKAQDERQCSEQGAVLAFGIHARAARRASRRAEMGNAAGRLPADAPEHLGLVGARLEIREGAERWKGVAVQYDPDTERHRYVTR